jgi:hypothetical protein
LRLARVAGYANGSSAGGGRRPSGTRIRGGAPRETSDG